MIFVVKFQHGSDLRRVAVEVALSYEKLRGLVRDLFGLENFTLRYKDSDGDVILISSNVETRGVSLCVNELE
jgi:hypothetical protein